jgi:hypothetical protein
MSFLISGNVLHFLSQLVGMILLPGNLIGNAAFKNEIASSFPILCKFKVSEKKYRRY